MPRKQMEHLIFSTFQQYAPCDHICDHMKIYFLETKAFTAHLRPAKKQCTVEFYNSASCMHIWRALALLPGLLCFTALHTWYHWYVFIPFNICSNTEKNKNTRAGKL